MGLVENLRNKKRGNTDFFGVEPPIPLYQLPKPPQGGSSKTKLRVLPPTKTMEYYYVEFRAHYNLGMDGKLAAICPRDLHGVCPLDDYANQVQERYGREETKDIFRTKTFGAWPKWKALTHVLGEDDPKHAKLFILGSAIEQSITALIAGKNSDTEPDDEEMEVFKPIGETLISARKGRWLFITTNANALPNDYYQVAPSKNETPIAKTVEGIKTILCQRIDLAELIKLATLDPDEIKDKYLKAYRGVIKRNWSNRKSGGKSIRKASGKARGMTGKDEDIPF